MSTACTPGIRARRLGVDAADRGMRVRAAHERRLRHAGEFEIVDETAFATQQRPVLRPADPASP